MLIIQTAHQSSAKSAYLSRRERQVLLLRHFYRYRLKISEKSGAARRAAARAQPSEHFSLVAHAYLPQLYSRLEYSCQVFNQLTEVNSALCREMKYYLAGVERILHVNELHFQIVLFYLLSAYIKRLLFQTPVFFYNRVIMLVRFLFDSAQRFGELAVIHCFSAYDYSAEFNSPHCFDNYSVAYREFFLSGCKVVHLTRFFKSNAYHVRHFTYTSKIDSAAPSNKSLLFTPELISFRRAFSISISII